MVRTSEDSDQSYPLCHHCQNVRKLGPVKKRKKRTVESRGKKEKNKRKKGTKTVEKELVNFLDNMSEDSEQEYYEVHEKGDESVDEESSDDSLNWEVRQRKKRKKTVVSRLLQKEDIVQEGEDDVQDHHVESDDVQDQHAESDDVKDHHAESDDVHDQHAESDDDVLSVPPSPNMYLPASVDDLLDGSD